MNSVFKNVALCLALVLSLAFVSPLMLHAQSLDELSQSIVESQPVVGQESQTTVATPDYSNVTGARDDMAISDYLKGYNPITSEQMAEAVTITSPIVNFLGIVSGAIITVVWAAVFVVTAIDFLYIAVPTVRPLIDGGGTQQSGMMQGGYGSYGSMQPQQQNKGFRLVSDEAKDVVTLHAGGGQQQGGGYNGGYGGGYGQVGMQQPQKQNTKLLIGEYLKKRTLFMIIFTIATTLLMSSVFTDCGLNLAELAIKIFEKLNGKIASVQV